MVVFGIPKAHGDDPIRVIRAAYEIHESVENYSPQVEKIIGRPLECQSFLFLGAAEIADGNMTLGLKMIEEEKQFFIREERKFRTALQ